LADEIEPTQPPADGRQRQRAKAAATRNRLLNAAGDVVRTEGVSGLTLERVAETAGVSKGGLLYHFASKQELVVGLLSRTLTNADDTLQSLTDGQPVSHGAFARAYLEYVTSGQHGEADAAAGIFAAAALDDGDLTPAQEQFTQWQERLVTNDGIDPTVALLARVVGDGLWLIDLFGLAPPDPTQRQRLAELVTGLIDGAAHPDLS
jgi:AcrR family transcriptional regulator